VALAGDEMEGVKIPDSLQGRVKEVSGRMEAGVESPGRLINLEGYFDAHGEAGRKGRKGNE